ncbi:hypothetical protein HDU98_008518 [Podochytrium sp. JEL0797]|nr:hypothetical protein HDU98_008518 [Podochytrium sp. JEL0797]
MTHQHSQAIGMAPSATPNFNQPPLDLDHQEFDHPGFHYPTYYPIDADLSFIQFAHMSGLGLTDIYPKEFDTLPHHELFDAASPTTFSPELYQAYQDVFNASSPPVDFSRRESVLSIPTPLMPLELDPRYSPYESLSPQSAQARHLSATSMATDFFFHVPGSASHSPSMPTRNSDSSSSIDVDEFVFTMDQEESYITTSPIVSSAFASSPTISSPVVYSPVAQQQSVLVKPEPIAPVVNRLRITIPDQYPQLDSNRVMISPVVFDSEDTASEASPAQPRHASTIESTIESPVSNASPKKLRAHASSSVTSGARFLCPYDGCDKAFPRQYNLKSHMYCHSGERPHVCQMCSSAFARKHDLQRHVRTLHAITRPYKCDTCNMSFQQPEQLKRHQIQEKQLGAGGVAAVSLGTSSSGRKGNDSDDDYC